MQSKVSTIIISIVILLIFAVFAIFGIVAWQEFKSLTTSKEPEEVQTVVSRNSETIDENIKAPNIIENPLEEIEEDEKEDIDYSDVNINKYYYNQLDEHSKTIYKAFEANKENMKTGNYKVELGSSFSELLKKDDGQDRLGELYQSAIEAYTYDNPDVFYLTPNKMYLNIETTTKGSSKTYYVYVSSGEQPNYLIDEFSSKGQIDSALQEIREVRSTIMQNKKSDTYSNIKMVHDYLIYNIQYDTSISRPNIYNIYGAMVNNVAVCEGYARSFKYLMDALNIPCVLVIGTGTNTEGRTENHAWNYVQLDGSWYAMDCTWDDPVSATGWVSNASKYRYFLKGSADMSNDHRPSNRFTPEGRTYEYPPLSNSNYD